jgi:hypothetical protein
MKVTYVASQFCTVSNVFNNIHNVRVTALWRVRVMFMPNSPNHLVIFHSKTAPVWWFYVAGNNIPYLGLHVKFPMFLTNCNQKWIFATGFNGSCQYEILRKSVQWETNWYMRTDRRTDMTKLVGAFHCANAPKNWWSWNWAVESPCLF